MGEYNLACSWILGVCYLLVPFPLVLIAIVILCSLIRYNSYCKGTPYACLDHTVGFA